MGWVSVTIMVSAKEQKWMMVQMGLIKYALNDLTEEDAQKIFKLSKTQCIQNSINVLEQYIINLRR